MNQFTEQDRISIRLSSEAQEQHLRNLAWAHNQIFRHRECDGNASQDEASPLMVYRQEEVPENQPSEFDPHDDLMRGDD